MHWALWILCIYVSIGLIFGAYAAKGCIGVRVATYLIAALLWLPILIAVLIKCIREYQGDTQ